MLWSNSFVISLRLFIRIRYSHNLKAESELRSKHIEHLFSSFHPKFNECIANICSSVVKVTAQPCFNLWNCPNIYAAATETFCGACFLRMNLRPPAKRNGTRPSFTMLCLKWAEEEPRMFAAVDVSWLRRLCEWNMYLAISLRAVSIVEYGY